MGNFWSILSTISLQFLEAQTEWLGCFAAYCTHIPAGTPESRAKMWCDQYLMTTFSREDMKNIRKMANERYRTIDENIQGVCQIFLDMDFQLEQLPDVIATLTEYNKSADLTLYHDLFTSWKNYKSLENYTDSNIGYDVSIRETTRAAYLTQFKTTYAKFLPITVDKDKLLDALACTERNKQHSEMVTNMLSFAGVHTNNLHTNNIQTTTNSVIGHQMPAITFSNNTLSDNTPPVVVVSSGETDVKTNHKKENKRHRKQQPMCEVHQF